jgi:hypothetical protein
MCVHAKTVAAHKGDLGIRDLPFTCLAAQLSHRLDDMQHTAAVAFSQQSATGIYRQVSPRTDAAALHKGASFAFGTESVIFKLHQDDDGKTIVEQCQVDIGCGDTSSF